MANESIFHKELLKGLSAHLVAKMPSIKKVYDDFPDPNQALDMPCLSIFTQPPQFQNLQPYVIGQTEPDPETHKATITYVIGMYDFTMQLDLWCAYKIQRHALYNELFHALNPNVEVGGLSLELPGYHGQWARLDLVRVENVEDEAGAQRSEWRLKADLLVNCRAIKEVDSYLMETIENTLETPNMIESD